VPDDWRRHDNDNDVGNDICGGKDGQHVECVGTLCKEQSDGCPVPVPSSTTLEDCRKEEGYSPSSCNDDHGPASNSKPSNVAKETLPEEKDRDFDQSESGLFHDLECVLVLLDKVFKRCTDGPIVNHRRVTSDGTLDCATQEDAIETKHKDLRKCLEM
jgi:hypothetical protein